MKLQNNYIFLQREKSKDKPTNEIDEKGNHIIRVNIPEELRTHLDRIFDLKHDDWKVKSKYFRYITSFQFTLSGFISDVEIEVYNVQGNRYLNIEVNSSTQLRCAKTLENINSKLLDTVLNKQYIIITAYDAVSEFYCNKIFSKFARFERLFRRLLFNIYILNYEKEYYEKTISKEIVNKAKGNIRAKSPKGEQYLKEFFYSLDYGDLQELLFAKKWTSIDEAIRENFLSNHDDLSSISDEELRQFIQSIGAKSDWDRLFKDKISLISIEEDMSFIRSQRNKVAHSKFFSYEDYTKSMGTLDKLLIVVEDAINLTQSKDFLEKNSDNLKIDLQGIIKALGQFSKFITESIGPLYEIQEQFTSVFKPFAEYAVSLQQSMRPFFELVGKAVLNMSQNDCESGDITEISENNSIGIMSNADDYGK